MEFSESFFASDLYNASFSNKLFPIKEEAEENDDKKEPPKELTLLARSDTLRSPARFPFNEDFRSPETDELPPISNSPSPTSRKMKRTNSMKQVTGGFNEFPVLVRGFDIENAHSKLSSLHTYDRRASSDLSKGWTGEEHAFTLYKIETVDLKEEESSEDEEEYRERLTLIELDRPLPIYNIKNLQKVLKPKERVVEDFLELALNDQKPLLTKKKPSFWNKLGFKDKKRETEMIQKAIEEWSHTERDAKELNSKINGYQLRFENLTEEKKQTLEDCRNLRIQINSILSSITEEKMLGMMKYEEIVEELSDAKNVNESLSRELQMNEKNMEKRLEEAREYEERWKMKIEDSRVELINVIRKRIIAETQEKKHIETIEKLENEHKKCLDLQEKTDMALNLLSKTLDYFENSEEHAYFNNTFIEALKQLKLSSSEALKAEKEFEKQATTDPREIIYYSRAGNYSKPSALSHSRLNELTG